MPVNVCVIVVSVCDVLSELVCVSVVYFICLIRSDIIMCVLLSVSMYFMWLSLRLSCLLVLLVWWLISMRQTCQNQWSTDKNKTWTNNCLHNCAFYAQPHLRRLWATIGYGTQIDDLEATRVSRKMGTRGTNEWGHKRGRKTNNAVCIAKGKKRWEQPNENEWEAVKNTVDSGAVGTVGHKGIAKGIP